MKKSMTTTSPEHDDLTTQVNMVTSQKILKTTLYDKIAISTTATTNTIMIIKHAARRPAFR